MSSAEPSTSSIADQWASIPVDVINAARLADEALQLANQDTALENALNEMASVRGFVGDPSQILGSPATKHGEIAEVVEVGVRRARDVLVGENPTATFEGVGRTAPSDYLIDGIDVQSKFHNGANNSLSAVLKHMEQYKNFGRDGSYYHLPKDQHEQILRILNGDTSGMSDKSVRAVLEKVQEIEASTGKAFTEVVRPSLSEYPEVQQGKVIETLDKHERELQDKNEDLKNQIEVDHKPSIEEGLKATSIAAVVGATVGFATASIKKYQKEGKNIFKGDFTTEDWKDVGGSTLTGGAMGAVTGAMVYTLTNCAELSAPLAGAFVSAVKGLGSLTHDYHEGKITIDQLVDGGMLVCTDVALVGLCTAAGQILIPLPVLGAVLGSIVGKVLTQVAAGQIKGLQEAVDKRMSQAMEKLDAAYQAVVTRVTAEFSQLGDLTVAAFDITRNTQLVQASLELARKHGVDEKQLLLDHADLDRYMLD